MALVQVRYRVTVWTTVDLDRGRVTEVFIDDESVRLDDDPALVAGGDDDPLDVVESMSGSKAAVTREMAERAVSVAEAEVWPGWKS